MRPSSGACGWLDVRGRCSLARTCDATSGASSSDVSLFMGVTAPTLDEAEQGVASLGSVVAQVRGD